MGTNEQHLANNNPPVWGSSLNYQNWAGPLMISIFKPPSTQCGNSILFTSHILRETDEKHSQFHTLFLQKIS